MRHFSLANSLDGDGDVPPDALEPIAIVGFATRFPQEANTTETLWELLLQSRSTWSTIPEERFNADAFYHPDPEHGGTFHVQGGHYLSEDPAHFDGPFFNITRNELLTLDPQQRLVMENVYHALENAGIPMASAVGSNTSVFVSGFNHDYLGILNSDPETAIKYKPTGVTNAILSNRVSWFFDFKGPSMTIDTACSSSLVALHLAVQSLRSRETNMALVSGVSILENPVETIGMSHHGLLGPQGRSFSFDSRAEGYARGEGVGTVVLKPLHAAVRDGDTIRAVIRETGVNQDGRTPGITVPSAEAQERLIREIYWRAGLDMAQTRFVEAHGTGTSTGDPIEAGALARAFKCHRDTPLYIGTIKSTIGHLEGGSGVAGIIKSILILESAVIPPNFDIQQINPQIPAADWDIAFPTENTAWPSSGLRRISINSFGIGGTNAHCVLDDAFHYLDERHISAIHHTAPTVPKIDHPRSRLVSVSKAKTGRIDSSSESADDSDHSDSGATFIDTPTSEGFCESPPLSVFNAYSSLINIPRLFLLSAFDEAGVQRNASLYAQYLKRKITRPGAHDHLLNDFSFTLANKRSLFPWKTFVAASTTKELSWNLSEHNFIKPIRTTSAPDISYVFTGQGAQYQAMGRALMAYPVFQASLEDASNYVRRLGSPWSLIDELLTERKSPRISLPEIAHPLCTALQVAIVDLLASWGIFPTSVTGHSSGEIAAAYCAGKISREGAWKVAYYRGYVSSKQLSANGAMMAVGLGPSQLEPYLESVRKASPGELIIACYNSPKNNTVSGDQALVDALKEILDADGVFARKLNVKNAYHSAHMQAIAEEYLQLMDDISFGHRLAVPHLVHMFSTVTGDEVTAEHLPGQYWVDNMVSPVRFTGGLIAMYTRSIASGFDSNSSDSMPQIVEIGPHSTLQSAIKETLSANNAQSGLKYLAVLNRNDPSLNVLITAVGFLAANGSPLDLHKVNLASRPQAKRPSKLLVDLPPYSFKHTEKIIYESRLSRNLRTRRFPRHDLFGAPVVDWDSNIPRWRHFVRLHENPWLRDHVVTGSVVYPGVGFLVMAIEASRQLLADKNITGFHLRRVFIRRALIVPDTKDGIEVSLSMTTVERSPESRTWRRFQISSYNESSGEWTEHCNGYITVECVPPSQSIDYGREKLQEAQAWKEEFEQIQQTCTRPMNFRTAYNNLQTCGLHFGPLFRNLDGVQTTGSRVGTMTGVVTVPDIAPSMPKQYMHQHLIHPATMDSMIHMMIAAVLDITGKTFLEKIRLPTYIRDMWVSADLISKPLSKFIGHASVSSAPSEKFEGRIRMLDANSKAQRVKMDGIELTPLDSGPMENPERQICTAIEWKPDVHFLDSKTACELSTVIEPNLEQELYWAKRFQLACMLYITDALDELKGIDVVELDVHLRRFYDWMKHMQQGLVEDKIIHLPYGEFKTASQDSSLKQTIDREIESHSAEGAITARLGRNVAAVMRREVDPLQLMFGQDSVIEEVYKESLHLHSLPTHLHNHLSLLQHQHSGLNILEVGGGTGSFTAEVLSVLSPDASKGSIASYTFTDISSRFFEKAKRRFQPWSDMMTFQSLHIENSPVDQGFQTGVYDLIFAGNVIHATANLHTALRNLRSLLRPGGQLIMQEGIRQDFLWYSLVFGQLPGWWLGNEPIRQWCPYIPATEWNTLLSESGFSGVDIEYPSSEREDLSWQSILVSTAVASEDKPLQSVFILTSGSTRMDSAIATLQDMFQRDETNVTLVKPSELDRINLQDALFISLLDMELDWLKDIDERTFTALREALIKCQQILWVTLDPHEQPFASMSLGLLRTVRWERDADGCNIVTLAIADRKNVTLESLATCIQKVTTHQFVEKHGDDRHAEYLLQNNIIHIGRLREWKQADNLLAAKSSTATPEMQRLEDVSRPIELAIPIAGPNELYWITDTGPNMPLGGSEIEVNVCAAGLNSDVGAFNISNEAAGTVSRVGTSVDGFAPGDNIVYLTGDERHSCLRTVERVDQALAVKLPEDMSLPIAASLPSVCVTVLYGLQEMAKLCEEDSILIHNGADALGQVAIQYARLVRAKVYVTVSTSGHRELLTCHYGIPEDHVFSNQDLSFTKGIMRRTKGAGVDVIFNTLSGERMQESVACMAPFGRFIDASTTNPRADTTIELAPLQQNVTITKIEISSVARSRPNLIRRLLGEAVGLFSDHRMSLVQPLTLMGLGQLETGIRALQGKEDPGKIVVGLSSSDVIPVAPEVLTPYQFDGAASYVLAGGLGGLGRSLARWMASRGARSLIFLSRSGKVTDPVTEMISDLKDMRCNVHIFKCDVADAGRLRAVVEECSASLPPIKGCMQGSMVLRDGAFATMSFEDWQAAVRPKVQGSWNLHEVLPADLDFFVMLSSVAGIFGNRGQSNYAAGNTFQDALAAFRTARGMNACSINLGSVSNVGWVAENRSSMRTYTATLFELLREDEVQGTIEFLIDPRYRQASYSGDRSRSQLVLGLPTAEMCRQNDIPAPTYLNYSLFTHLRTVSAGKATESVEQKTVSTAALLSATSSQEGAVSVVSNGIVERLSSLLAIPTAEIDAQRFGFGGIDSLVAMEFRSWIVKELKAEVSLLDIMGARNIRALSEKIAQTSRLLGTVSS
ncbi:Acyl transferase/acyl hydrolase/lysophospholipase [Penicillium hispanicum]|uniref:Acyl transferase/acyl hydrolase/lysophospholipase n=1 Tax=Penicillium hispanicum TaxID=1080232 RepID=UPI0025420093|nr:Acyl transferase/acyl hydrolase/lysophospholipase [Penicillium hispanicum]KAJ5591646.1 Acyl transferase/acyl hydrolase/lysophospholipase [Penicillium hispanicum]